MRFFFFGWTNHEPEPPPPEFLYYRFSSRHIYQSDVGSICGQPFPPAKLTSPKHEALVPWTSKRKGLVYSVSTWDLSIRLPSATSKRPNFAVRYSSTSVTFDAEAQRSWCPMGIPSFACRPLFATPGSRCVGSGADVGKRRGPGPIPCMVGCTAWPNVTNGR